MPFTCGVPLKTPLLPRIRPCGSEPPLTFHAMGPVPVAANVSEYAVLCTAPVICGPLVMDGARIPLPGEITRLNMTGPALPTGLVAFIENVKDPLCAGVPLITPVGVSESPEGRLPDVTDHVIGNEPVATRAD